MRAISSDFYSYDPTDSFRGVLDQFASLRTYSGAAPGASGYRVLSQRRSTQRRVTARALSPMTSAALAALARARLRLTGFLSVLFVGCLGLAVLAGPASCPSCSDSSHGAQLASSTLLEADVIPAGVSPITTSALEPSREAVPAKHDSPTSSVIGHLPAEIVTVSDAGPSVQLAALASPVSDVPELLPAVEVTSPTTKITARETEAGSEGKSHPRRNRVIRAYRTPIAKTAKHAPRVGDYQLVQRAPRWAQQMYVSPWQTQAFSYTR